MAAVTDLSGRLAEAEARYVDVNPESRRLHGQRTRFMPGGSTRTTIHQPPFPLEAIRAALADGIVLGPVRNESDIPDAPELRALLHLHMLERGFSYGRRGFVALSLPLGEAEIDAFAGAVEEFVETA